MYLTKQEIESFISQFDKDTKAIKIELLKLCWYMRGGLNYGDAHLLTPEERLYINNIIEENLQTTKETGLPFF